MNIAFAYAISDRCISTSSGNENRTKIFVRTVSTIMKLVTLKNGNLSTYFDVIDESKGGINNSSLNQILINSQAEGNRGVIRRNLLLNRFSGFVDRSRK